MAINLNDIVVQTLTPDEIPEGLGGQVLRRALTTEVVVDSAHPNVRKVIHDNGVVTFYLPDGWRLVEINEDALRNGIAAGISVFGIGEIAHVEIDSDEQRTCKFFSTNRTNFEEGEVKLSSSFKFYKPGSMCSCSNPVLTKHSGPQVVACEYAGAQMNCDVYQAQEWAPVRIVEATNEGSEPETLSLETTRKGHGVPLYRFEDQTGAVTALDNVEAFEAKLTTYDKVVDQTVGEAVVKESFLEFVLAE